MSRAYTKRINNVLESYVASLVSLQFIDRRYNDSYVAQEFFDVTLHQIRVAASQIEDAFYVRLFAEYQGILKDHLRSTYSDTQFDDQTSDLDWLLSQIREKENISVNSKLRDDFNRARTYRNHIAHNSSPYADKITIREAAEFLSKIVSKFTEPTRG